MRTAQYCSFKYHIDTVNSDYSSGYLRKGSETRDSRSPWQPVLHCQREQMKSRSTLLSARAWHAASRAKGKYRKRNFISSSQILVFKKQEETCEALHDNSVTTAQ